MSDSIVHQDSHVDPYEPVSSVSLLVPCAASPPCESQSLVLFQPPETLSLVAYQTVELESQTSILALSVAFEFPEETPNSHLEMGSEEVHGQKEGETRTSEEKLFL